MRHKKILSLDYEYLADRVGVAARIQWSSVMAVLTRTWRTYMSAERINKCWRRRLLEDLSDFDRSVPA